MNKTFNLEDMENMAKLINITRNAINNSTEDLVAPIRDYCIDVRKWVNDEKAKMIKFINNHSDFFYKFNPNEKYYSHAVLVRNCRSVRNWNNKKTSVYFGNIEILVNPMTGVAFDINLDLDFQYNNKIGTYRPHSHNKIFDEKTNFTIDYWTDTKKGCDELKEDFGFLIDEFTKTIRSLYSHDISRLENVIATNKEVEAIQGRDEEKIIIIVKR